MQKSIIMLSLTLSALASTSLMQSCRKTRCFNPNNPNCENYDPCLNKKLENEILMSNEPSIGTINWFQPDVKFWRYNIHFKPALKIKDATYTWYLGSEVIEEFEFTRNFDVTKPTLVQGIPIKLIIKRPKQLDCFPKDDGLDTFERKIYFYENYCESLIVGKFKVKFDNFKDSVIIQSVMFGLPVPRQWKYREDSCNDKNGLCELIWLGFNSYSKIYPDTTWNGMNSISYYNYSSFIMQKQSNTTENTPYNGEFRVNPVTWEVQGNYVFYENNFKSTPHIYFRGRKIQ